MKKLALPGLLIAIVAATLAASSTAEMGVGVRHEAISANEGILSVVGAEGLPIRVVDSEGNHVLRAFVPAPYWEVVVPNSGPGQDGIVLRVKMPAIKFSITDKDDDWIWE